MGYAWHAQAQYAAHLHLNSIQSHFILYFGHTTAELRVQALRESVCTHVSKPFRNRAQGRHRTVVAGHVANNVCVLVCSV